MIERILSPLGRRVDEAAPLVDARLPDGSRVNCVIPPLSLDGPLLTIRRFRRRGFRARGAGRERHHVARTRSRFLRESVLARRNVVVSGGTGSGKTTLLNVLSSFVGRGERVITIEDAAELRLRQPHVLRLESRPANLEGGGEVTIRQLVRNALRMRPDRIIVGEVRGAEALDMLQALNTGHDGSMTTVHANSAADALRRIETLALMADVALPHVAVRQQAASAIDLVVHLERAARGATAPWSRSSRWCGSRPRSACGRCSRRPEASYAGCAPRSAQNDRDRSSRARRARCSRPVPSSMPRPAELPVPLRAVWPSGSATESTDRGSRCATSARSRARFPLADPAAAIDRSLRRRRSSGAALLGARGAVVCRVSPGLAGARGSWPHGGERYGRPAGRRRGRRGAGDRRRDFTAGASVRTSVAIAAHRLSGPIAAELGRTAWELEMGAGTEAALERLRGRSALPRRWR